LVIWRTTRSISRARARLHSAMRAPVPAALPALSDLVERRVGDHAQHHRVFGRDMRAEGPASTTRSTLSTPRSSISSRAPA
jgi:hypothetical protein